MKTVYGRQIRLGQCGETDALSANGVVPLRRRLCSLRYNVVFDADIHPHNVPLPPDAILAVYCPNIKSSVSCLYPSRNSITHLAKSGNWSHNCSECDDRRFKIVACVYAAQIAIFVVSKR